MSDNIIKSRKSKLERRIQKRKRRKKTILISIILLILLVLLYFFVSTLNKTPIDDRGFKINDKTIENFEPEGKKEEYRDNNIGKKMCLEVPSFVRAINGKFELFIRNNGDYDSIPRVDLLNEETGETTNLFEAKQKLTPSNTILLNIELTQLKGNKLYIYDNSELGAVGVKYLIPIKQ